MSLLEILPGATADVVSPAELEKALATQDARLRNELRSVKPVRQFWNVGTIGASQPTFNIPGPTAGFAWSVMLIGVELSGNGAGRLYRTGSPPGGAGLGGLYPLITSWTTVNNASLTFAKGQVPLFGGEQLVLQVTTAAINLIGVHMTAIQIASERFGELLL